MKAEIFLLVGFLCSMYNATNMQGVHCYNDCVCFQPTKLLAMFTKDPTVVGVALVAMIFIWYYHIYGQFVVGCSSLRS